MSENLFAKRFPPGHYYSPLPTSEEAEECLANYSRHIPTSLQGIELRTEYQLRLLRTLLSHSDKLPQYGKEKLPGLRFHLNQSYFGNKDAAIYFLMICHLTPKRIIEVGCGHSSYIALDANHLIFNNQIHLSFIDPDPDRFLFGLKSEDRKRFRFYPEKLQKINVDFFSELQENDILFIDSSHVSKIGSDVNYLLFEILPSLKQGVYIHFHDIFYPFEYLPEWLKEGRAWNEAYMLRAFLQFNNKFKIELFINQIKTLYPEEFESHPFYMRGIGSSIWLRKATSN